MEWIEYKPKIVKAIFDLYGEYKFRTDEIAEILNNESIYRVLSNRICIIIEDIINLEENPNIEKIPNASDIEEDLKGNKQNVIEYIKQYKDELDINKNEYIREELDRVLSIIEKLEEIIDKYDGNFDPLEDKRPYKIHHVKTYLDVLKNKSKPMSESITHEAIIDEELFNKVQKKIEAEEENEEI